MYEDYESEYKKKTKMRHVNEREEAGIVLMKEDVEKARFNAKTS